MTRTEMAQQIVDWEARRDSQGRLKVYKLPSNDGGGSYEVAGINDRYHPAVLGRIQRLIAAGLHEKAEQAAVEHILNYTDVVKDWQADPAVELFLRDCCFNRGPGGAAKIFQMALRVTVDGHVGPKTIEAAKAYRTRNLLLLARLRVARERYEDIVAPGRPNLRAGMENRWDNAFEAAANLELLKAA